MGIEGDRLSGNFFTDVVEPVFSGVFIAFLAYWLLSKQPYSLRLIDLASFAFGFLALVGALFASYRYRDDTMQSIDRLIVQSALVDIGFDTVMDTIKVCERLPHTPYRPPQPGIARAASKAGPVDGILPAVLLDSCATQGPTSAPPFENLGPHLCALR